MIEAFQLVVIIFSLFAWSRALLRFRRRQLNLREFTFWTLAWGALALIAVLPKTTKFLSQPLGIGRPIDAIIYASIILLFYLIFRAYIKLESVERSITLLVRDEAIRNAKRPKKGKSV